MEMSRRVNWWIDMLDSGEPEDIEALALTLENMERRVAANLQEIKGIWKSIHSTRQRLDDLETFTLMPKGPGEFLEEGVLFNTLEPDPLEETEFLVEEVNRRAQVLASRVSNLTARLKGQTKWGGGER